MKVITPGELANHAGSKYLGVLVAAKYARSLNEFRAGAVEFEDEAAPVTEKREKLTTTALREVAEGSVDYTLVERRRPES